MPEQQNLKERDYWLNKLSGEWVKSVFPYRRDRRKGKENAAWEFDLPTTLSESLIRLANGSDYRLFMILLAGLNALLYKYTDNKDIIVGSSIYKQEVEGEFINTVLVLRNSFPGDATFKELLLKTRVVISGAIENQNYPMDAVIYKMGLLDDENGFPLFDVALLLKNIQEKNYLNHIHPNMIFSLDRNGENIRGVLEYNACLYEESGAARIAGHFRRLLQNAVSNIEIPLSLLDILPEEEKKQLLYDFNGEQETAPGSKTITRLFEEQVEKTPGNIAVVSYSTDHADGGPGITYRELNIKANRTAHFLRTKGVGPGTIAAVFMGSSIQRIAAVLGILKTGGAYLPIDPEFPQQRVLSILDECDVSVLLTGETLPPGLSYTLLAGIAAGKVGPTRTPPRKQIADFDALPFPDRTLVDYRKYHQYIGEAMVKHKILIQAARGCPYNCTFCHKIWPKTHVRRSPGNLFREILQCYKSGIRRFAFIDDIFNLDRKSSSKVFREIIDNKLDIQLFFCNGLRADILTKDYIDLMVEAGTVNIDVALESGSPRIQKMIRKNLDLDKFYENIHYITQKYPQVILEMEMMLGFPTETEEEALMTLDLLKKLEWVHFPNLHILKIYPTSDMAQLAISLGVKEELIQRSTHLAFHELPETLPFPKAFAREFQARFMNEYFLLKERLIKVLPAQAKVLTKDELLDKYDSYLPVKIETFRDITDFAGIPGEEMGEPEFPPEGWMSAPDFNRRVKTYFPAGRKAPETFKVLLLDISMMFSSNKETMIHNQSDEPLGLMYLLSYLNEKFQDRVEGQIYKTGVDFDSYPRLKEIILRFKPHLIGIRTLSYYKEFFHELVSYIKGLGMSIPIVSGGPYATSDYRFVLQDPNVDLVVLGEGEHTFAELVEKMMADGNRLPNPAVLETINGIAFVDKEKKDRLTPKVREVVVPDRLAEEIERYSPENPDNIAQPRDLLYLIATSGSTGKPKPVLIEHRNLVNLLDFQSHKTNIDFSRRVLQFASIGFDVSAQEIFSTLCAGGTLYVIPADMKTDILQLFDWIKKEEISILFLPPSFLKLIFSDPGYSDLFPRCVEHIIAAGEQLVVPGPLAEVLKKNRVRLHNHYGPTETHVVTALTIDPDGRIDQRPTIGGPIANTRIYILDENGGLKPIGAPGELHIAGANVGRGYLNNPELTAERFNRSYRSYKSYKTYLPGSYRTGDLARWLPDGTIECLGRADSQVQIRGFRIELGEIETRLLAAEGVKEAVVIDRQSDTGDHYLCAYLVSHGEITVSGLRETLSANLPEYMMPQYFVPLDSIPLTPNGKVDRKHLPSPEVKSERDFVPPRDELDKKFARIWSGVLGIEEDRTGIDDNFFELGGNSLKATILITKIHKAFNTKVTLGEIFETPTIRGLAGCLKTLEEEKYQSLEPVEKKEYYPFSSAQKRLYIQQQVIPGNMSYNMPAFFTLEGRLDRERLETVFRRLVSRHESLRTSFHMLDEEPVQRIHDSRDTRFEIEYSDLTSNGSPGKGGEDIIEGFVRPFDLAHAPLLRVGLVKTGEQGHILMVDMHHIITDGTSYGIISREFMQIYRGETPPPLTVRYKDFTRWQNRLFASEEIKNQEEYWLKQFEGDIPVLELPTDFPRPEVRSYEGWDIFFEIGSEKTAAVNSLAAETGATLHVVLLAIYTVLLFKYTGQEDIVVGNGIAGRRHADLENIVGLFINMLPMRNRPAGHKTFNGFLEEVKENALNAYANQDYQFEELVRKLNLQGNPARNPLFDVVFQTQNMDIPEIRIEGLTLRPYEKAVNASHFDLVIYVWEEGGSLKMRLLYTPALFKKSTLENMAEHFVEVADQVLKNGDTRLEDIRISTRFSEAAPKMHTREGAETAETAFQF